MSDNSSDSVGNDTSHTTADTANKQTATDSLSQAAQAASTSLQNAVDALSGVLDSPLGAIADALGLDQAMKEIADAFGLDKLGLDGVLGAALAGALTGGVPGAVMGVINAVTGGSLVDAARAAVAENLPKEFQPLANKAIDALLSKIPGAAGSINLNDPLSVLNSGVLTNGRIPGMSEITDFARTATEFGNTARSVMDAASRGNWADAIQAASHMEGVLGHHFEQARTIAASVMQSYEQGSAVYAQGGHGAMGDSAERFAIAAGQLMFNR